MQEAVRKYLNGRSEHERVLEARHFDKRMLYRIFLVALLTQMLCVYLTTMEFDSQRVLNILQRIVDNLTGVITGVLSALYILMRATADGIRGAERPAAPPATPPPGGG